MTGKSNRDIVWKARCHAADLHGYSRAEILKKQYHELQFCEEFEAHVAGEGGNGNNVRLIHENGHKRSKA